MHNKQIEINPKVEIESYDGDKFLRYYGTAKIVKNEKILKRAFDELPEVMEIFEKFDWNLVFSTLTINCRNKK